MPTVLELIGIGVEGVDGVGVKGIIGVCLIVVV